MILKLLLSLMTIGFFKNSSYCSTINEITLRDNSNFISKLPDTKLIRNLALIGSYQSASVKPIKYLRTQNLTITEQLKAGLRVLDIHLRLVDEKFELYYGPTYLSYTFDDILSEINEFIVKNPRELIIMLMKIEFDHLLPEFEKCQVLENYIEIWQGRGLSLIGKWSLLDDYVGEHRGHVLLSHVDGKNFDDCTTYLPCVVQNNWDVTDVEKKWRLIEDNNEEMFNGYSVIHSCFINYLFGLNPLLFISSSTSSDDPSDYLDVGLDRVEIINNRMANYFRNPYYTLVIIVTDFPSQMLIDKIIDSNFN
ncbi:1-phosphatidylinositol phosphodiesterase [Microplitis demolitor]|uniref:1-phosphatidylinositol phosphodiesterase n=1 Tax=Microplitis demolitor TaxID=69319 RepID=UPI0004CD04D4|nr:1-phosphatidylinositol phosphodiesterase [Microplitis demolitor]